MLGRRDEEREDTKGMKEQAFPISTCEQEHRCLKLEVVVAKSHWWMEKAPLNVGKKLDSGNVDEL